MKIRWPFCMRWRLDIQRQVANELRETLSIVNYIATKASLTDEEKLIDIRNLASIKEQ